MPGYRSCTLFKQRHPNAGTAIPTHPKPIHHVNPVHIAAIPLPSPAQSTTSATAVLSKMRGKNRRNPKNLINLRLIFAQKLAMRYELINPF